jgi:hypothetical protein
MSQPHRIGIVGYSGQKFDAFDATNILYDALAARTIHHGRCVVVSGYTDLGIPGIAYKVAVKLGMGTVGIACKKAQDYDCFDCDEVVIVGDDWGDESDTFLASIDEMIKVGGGRQSEFEFAAFAGPKEDFELEALPS